MNTLALTHFDEGVAHYRNGSFLQAEVALKRGLVLDETAWDVHFYLAMAYAHQGKMREAKAKFMAVRDWCPDQDLRRRAASAFIALTAPT